VRQTWGDGRIYDHKITYDIPNKKTIVENSLGAVTMYDFNVRSQVVCVTCILSLSFPKTRSARFFSGT